MHLGYSDLCTFIFIIYAYHICICIRYIQGLLLWLELHMPSIPHIAFSESELIFFALDLQSSSQTECIVWVPHNSSWCPLEIEQGRGQSFYLLWLFSSRVLCFFRHCRRTMLVYSSVFQLATLAILRCMDQLPDMWASTFPSMLAGNWSPHFLKVTKVDKHCISQNHHASNWVSSSSQKLRLFNKIS